MPRIELPLPAYAQAAANVSNAGPMLSGSLPYIRATYGDAAAQAYGIALWLGPRPIAVAFTIPPQPPP